MSRSNIFKTRNLLLFMVLYVVVLVAVVATIRWLLDSLWRTTLALLPPCPGAIRFVRVA